MKRFVNANLLLLVLPAHLVFAKSFMIDVGYRCKSDPLIMCGIFECF